MELMARKLSGEAAPEELQELQDHLSADPAAGERSKVLDQFWSSRDDGTHQSMEENLKKVLTGLNLPHKTAEVIPLRRKRRWLTAAAVILVLLGIPAILIYRGNKTAGTPPLASLMEKHNAKGTKSISFFICL